MTDDPLGIRGFVALGPQMAKMPMARAQMAGVQMAGTQMAKT